MSNNQYPEWKKAAWRFGRVFLNGVLGGIGVISVVPADFSSIQKAYAFFLIVLAVGIASGLTAIFKYLREHYGSVDKGAMIDKLPL